MYPNLVDVSQIPWHETESAPAGNILDTPSLWERLEYVRAADFYLRTYLRQARACFFSIFILERSLLGYMKELRLKGCRPTQFLPALNQRKIARRIGSSCSVSP